MVDVDRKKYAIAPHHDKSRVATLKKGERRVKSGYNDRSIVQQHNDQNVYIMFVWDTVGDDDVMVV